jgi:hypothetical protein
MRPSTEAIRNFALSLRPRLASEDGVALPVVILGLVAAFALSTATVIASVNAQSGTVRDQGSKEALAAAEAGVSEALLHYNRLRTADPNVCVSGTTTLVAGPKQANGWCAPQTRTLAGTTNTYTYSVRPDIAGGELEIVSSGNVGGVTRRVDVTAYSSGGQQPFTDSSIIGLDGITIDPSAVIAADVATNGGITISSSGQLICEDAHVGPGRSVTGGTSTCQADQAGTPPLPPVNPGSVWTTNNNSRICVEDRMTPNCTGAWNPTTRVLSMQNKTLTLGAAGGTYNYSLCRIVLQNGNAAIYIAGGSTVRIYFGSPEQCGLTTTASRVQLDMGSGSKIESTGAEPAHLAMLFVGSSNLSTTINLRSNAVDNQVCTSDFVIYAPLSHVNFMANAHYCGAIAARSVKINSQASITASANADEFELPNSVAHHFVTEDFIECATTNTTTTPDTGC